MIEEPAADPVQMRHRDLEQIAMAALQVARLFLECGAKVSVVHEGAGLIVRGLGAEFVGGRAGYASHEITVKSGVNTITRMIAVGRHGVNHRLDYALRALCLRVAEGGMTAGQVAAEIARVAKETKRYRPVCVAGAVGIACAAFGRLLGVDWAAAGPVLLAGVVGQYGRYWMVGHRINEYVVAAVIAFFASGLGGLGARALGSQTVPLAMMASILLLVPGIPATNAQTDIMDGYPAMGSARAVTVLMVMIFATVGVWIAETAIGVRG